MSLQYIASEKGKVKVYVDGYLYTKDNERGGKTFWKCDHWRKLKCGARLHIKEDVIVKKVSEHNHAGDAARYAAAKLKSTIKIRAKYTYDDSEKIITDALSNVSEAVMGQLPDIKALKRNIRNVRNREFRMPSFSGSLSDIKLPEEYMTTQEGEGFLLYDNYDKENRIIAFGTRKNLKLLAGTNVWYISVANQTTVIHMIQNNIAISAVYCLLKNNTEEAYIALFNSLKEIEPNLGPKNVITDLDELVINCLRIIFPTVKLTACFFHFCQNIFRFLQSNGLQEKYNTDADFALKVRMLVAVTFVPVEDVERVFEELFDCIQLEEIAQPLIDYFEDTFIGRPGKIQRRKPKYDIDHWNCYSAINEGTWKAHGSCETWYRAFKSSLASGVDPFPWSFIKLIKKEHSANMDKLAEMGLNSTKNEWKKGENGRKIEQNIKNYGKQSIVDYLRSFAHNFIL